MMCIFVCPNSISQHSNIELHPKCYVQAILLPPPMLEDQLHLSLVCDLAKWMKKSQNVMIWLSKMILALYFAEFAEGNKGPNKA